MLPPLGAIGDAGVRRWLARGAVTQSAPGFDICERALLNVGAPLPHTGLAALRRWGQTGERSEGWICAADPVHFEARMRDLVTRSFVDAAPVAEEIQAIAADLQAALGDDRLRFEALDDLIYLHSANPIATASVPPAAADGAVPDVFLPAGAEAASGELLQAEVQMLLHEHPLNRERARAGIPAISTLWFWGGGSAPAPVCRKLPLLLGGDPLLRGIWQMHSGTIGEWCGAFDERAAAKAGGCLLDLRNVPGQDVDKILLQLRALMQQGGLSRVTLHFRDRHEITIRRSDAWKFWRQPSPLLAGSAGDE
jgi:hypothetical protein